MNGREESVVAMWKEYEPKGKICVRYIQFGRS